MRFRGEMDDRVGFVLGQRPVYGRSISNVTSYERVSWILEDRRE
jgi:hypothetical protein